MHLGEIMSVINWAVAMLVAKLQLLRILVMGMA